MPNEETEIHAKLVLDEHAEHAVEHLKEGFEGINERVHETTHELMGMAKQALAVAAGFELTHGIESVKEFGQEVMHAAIASEDQERGLAGLVAMTDKTGMSFDETLAKGRELHEGLEQIAIKAGQSGSAVSDAFEMIAARSNKSTEEVMALTDKMAVASRIMPGGIGQIANAWRDLETGIVRPRNAIVQLLVQTHTVSGTMRSVAKGLSSMMQSGQSERVFQLAEQAIDKMTKTAAKAPPTFNQTMESLRGIRELAFKNFGEPMLAAVGPSLERLRSYFLDNQETIERWARMAGEKVGKWMEEAAAKIQEGFEYIQTHADEIKDAITTAFNMAKTVIEFILAHKEEIAIAFGAKMAVGLGQSIAGGIAGMAGGAGAMGAGGAATLALASTGLAIDQMVKLWNEMEHSGKSADAAAKMVALESEARQGNTQYVQQLRDDIVALNPELVTMANNLVEMANSVKKAQGVVDQGTDQDLDFADKMAAGPGNSAQIAVESFMGRLGDAIKEQDGKTAEHMAQFLTTHQNLLDAMHKTGVSLGDEGKFLVGALENIGQHMVAEEIRGILTKQGVGKEGAKPAQPIQDFRGSTFHIKQDFRDQDPDRVIFTFRKDVVRNADARVQSRMATPFGL